MPTISFHVPLQQTDLGLRYTYGLYWYQDRQELGVNPFDQTHQLDLWVDHAFNERWKGKVTDTFAVGQEPELLSPNPVTGVATPYRINGDNLSNHGDFELDTEWTRLFSTTLSVQQWLLRLRKQRGDVVNQTEVLMNGNQRRPSLAGILDRVEENVALDLQWHVSPNTTAFVGYSFAWVNYTGDEPIAVVPFDRIQLHLSQFRPRQPDPLRIPWFDGGIHPNLSASIRAGASYTDVYADPLYPSTSWAPYADISLSYTYIPGSYVQFGFTQNVGATDQVATGVTGELLIQQLERRLDNVAYRLGFAISRRQARQVVRHGHVTVNGKKVNIPSYQVQVGDEIAIRESARKLLIVEQGAQYAAQNPVPGWLEANFDTFTGRVLSLPKRKDVNLPINEQLIVELYSK